MKKVLIFVLGAAAGSLVTWKIVEEKYKRIADEEIESVIKRFNDKMNEINELKENDKSEASDMQGEEPVFTDEEKETYEDIRVLYADGEEILTQVIDEDGNIIDVEHRKPYVIPPEEFGEYGNEMKSLIYYADFVLADDNDDIVTDPESLIGDALDHFGEYEDDSVHVRNEDIECDFEILKSEKTFGEVYKGDN